jgi:hypothetical protein
LSNPGQITQPVLDYLGIDAETIQQGMAEMHERAVSLHRRAKAFREFYNNPESIQAVQQTADRINEMNQRGLVAMNDDVSIIRAFTGKQDRSTMLHEIMHVYNGHLIRAAQTEGASEQLRKDFETLNRAVGGGLESSDKQTRLDAEERLAKLSERYIYEGKAPAPELSSAFHRFRTWLSNVYRGVRDFVAQDLSPEVRGAFDRMMATDEDIAQAREYYREVDALSAPIGATPEQAADIAQRVERAQTSTDERQFNKVLRQYQESLGGKREIRRQAGEAIRQSSQYKAIKAIIDNFLGLIKHSSRCSTKQ